jgi:retron-type reverse transcriptase
LNNKQIKFLIKRYFYQDLETLQNEIQVLSKDVHPKILKSLDVNKNPIKDNCESILQWICLQQKLLSLSASMYGIYDLKTARLANNYLCSLVFRIYAVSELLENPGSKTPGVDGIVLSQTGYCGWVKYLSYSNVFRHKVSLIKKLFIPKFKGGERFLSIPTVADRLIQMLFAITYEPIVETVSDFYSFGFRKNRNAHQALGVLFNKLHDLYGKNKLFYAPKYVLNYGIQKFFDFANYNWLIQMFPAHNKHKFLINAWLKANISFKKVVLSNHEGFLQGSVIGPLLANFTLNGLENIIKFDKIGYQNEIKRK